MRNYFCVVFIILALLTGCATKTSYNYGSYQESLRSGMTFFSQYEIIYEKDKKTYSSPFLADENGYLPEKVKVLHLGLFVRNPQKVPFRVWVNYTMVSLDADVKMKNQVSTYVFESNRLPQEFVSIPLPMSKRHVQVEFMASVVSKNGEILYRSQKALYKMGVKKIKKKKKKEMKI